MPVEPSGQGLQRHADTLGDPPPAPGATWPPEPGNQRPHGREPIRLIAAAGLIAALFLGGVVGASLQDSRDHRATAAVQVVTPTRPSITPTCRAAVQQANRSLAVASKVQSNLDEHISVMQDLLHGRITSAEAYQRGLPSLVNGAKESARFDVVLADYRNLVRRCQLDTR